MNLESLIGQTLDSKYSIEKELGRGGMGAVYLATHVGTERPVALKVIGSQFMARAEFVERFRREARAAGRLRHPNVVDVTDFGFAETSLGRVAYLVMEYLDGCTLGEILDEEKKLPLGWTLDILEQICSAVHEAHGQGIIHRDLKPDNIWLEPNQRGGYTVKVLDFGIAKLEEPISRGSGIVQLNSSVTAKTNVFQKETLTDKTNAGTLVENHQLTIAGEGGTLIQDSLKKNETSLITAAEQKGTVNDSPSENYSENATTIMPAAEISLEDRTAIFPGQKTEFNDHENPGTRLVSTSDQTGDAAEDSSSSQLTRVGAVLGTPLYMSPEQCRGEKLTPRSDIYSLAVITYQMLSGKPPFEGDFTHVMDSHRETAPPPLNAKKVPRKVKQVLASGLAKEKDDRPQTAEAFASKLRSHSEGFGKLLQKALVIYSEHLPKFIFLAFLAHLPHIIFAICGITLRIFASLEVINTTTASVIGGGLAFVDFFLRILTAAFLVGTVTWLVAQFLAVPLRPVSIRSALRHARSRWKSLWLTVTASTLLSFIGFTLCILPGWYWSTVYMLIAPSIMMEDISGRAAFRRSKELIKRSFLTALAVSALIYIVPAIVGGIIGTSVNLFSKQLEKIPIFSDQAVVSQEKKGDDPNININFGSDGFMIEERDKRTGPAEGKMTDEQRQALMLSKLRRETISQILLELFLNPITILLGSLTNVILALMYFKTRQAGGESMQELLEKFEDSEHPRSNWQHRIRGRLIQSGRINSTEKR